MVQLLPARTRGKRQLRGVNEKFEKRNNTALRRDRPQCGGARARSSVLASLPFTSFTLAAATAVAAALPATPAAALANAALAVTICTPARCLVSRKR